MQNKIKIGVVGYGNFGKFMCGYLEKYFEVLVYDPKYIESKTLEEVCGVEYLIFAVNILSLKEICLEVKDLVKMNTKIIDVTSVKVLPLKILNEYFPNNPILGTHPIFGPQSGKNGIEGLTIVLCNTSLMDEKEYQKISKFLTEKLGLKVIKKTPEEHDKEMAHVQGLSHFIGRALSVMKIEDYETATNSYKQLVSLEYLVGNDSWELYQTIQNANPYTEKVRTDFLNTLLELENKLKNDSIDK